MHKFMLNRVDGESGAALILALLVLTVLTVFSMAAVNSTLFGLRVSNQYKIEQSTLYEADGGADYSAQLIARALANHNAISATDSASANITINAIDSDGKGTSDLEAIIGGSTAYNALYTVSSASPNVKMNFLGDTVKIDINFIRSRMLAGSSSEFASRYEGLGSGTSGSIALDYQIDSYSTNKNSAITVRAMYKCVEGGGRCL